jgi:hypothetical protein
MTLPKFNRNLLRRHNYKNIDPKSIDEACTILRRILELICLKIRIGECAIGLDQTTFTISHAPQINQSLHGFSPARDESNR